MTDFQYDDVDVSQLKLGDLFFEQQWEEVYLTQIITEPQIVVGAIKFTGVCLDGGSYMSGGEIIHYVFAADNKPYGPKISFQKWTAEGRQIMASDFKRMRIAVLDFEDKDEE